MQLAQVIGTATTTIKHPSMEGCKLLVVLPRLADDRTADGFPLLAVDQLGAGIGETVMITSDGASARKMFGVERTPVRWTVIGLKD
jgi:ethanolamine utilization protein EutN|tara:strand:- start:98 stop:355 length:258 start_codon:yes stop_codon:yes gene_type:complete